MTTPSQPPAPRAAHKERFTHPGWRFAVALILGGGLLGAGIAWFAADLEGDELHAESFAMMCVLVLSGLAVVAQTSVDFFHAMRDGKAARARTGVDAQKR